MTSHGFELVREHTVAEINSVAYHLRHVRTGAELVSLVNDDENKAFGVSFATPAADATGVAHILEHSVLAGSRKYPVKEAFTELMRGSVYSYLDATVRPDRTDYLVASPNLRAFYNLIDVYLDCVFFPRLSPQLFQQEGWHYDIDTPDASLVYKGVVFNEMKGAYSPDHILHKLSQASLFPDTAYRFDASGDPKHIPDLTFEQLQAFHERHYHPSNARLFFYGDDDPQDRLRLLDARLNEFSRIKADAAVPLQPRFSAPKRFTFTYAAASAQAPERPGAEDPAKGTMLTVNWMLDEVLDRETDLAFEILEQILVGTPAAPLYKALIDSGLGAGLAGGGLDGYELRQPMFSIGLKDSGFADADKVAQLITDTMATLAAQGIDPMTLEAALNTVEFRLRESNFASYPRGLALMMRMQRDWALGRDPLSVLAFAAPLAAIRTRVAGGERVFEALIRRYFIDNPHRTVVILKPDRAQAAREAAEERARLEQARAAMSAQALAAAVEATHALRRAQQTPDPPEALATIPSLRLADLPPRNKLVANEVGALGDVPVLYHDLKTNGVVYLDLGVDLHRLSADLLPYVKLFARALLETGTGRDDFVSLSQRIGARSGGIRPQVFVSAMPGAKTCAAWLFLRGRALPGQTGDLVAILRDVLTGVRLHDRERFLQLVLEEKTRLEARLPRGWRYPDWRLRANYHEAYWAEEQMAGISYLFFLRKLVGAIDSDWGSVRATLERIRDTLVDRGAMLANVTAEPAHWKAAEPQLADLFTALPRTAAPPAPWRVADNPRAEGLIVPAKVNYVCKGADLHALGVEPGGHTLVTSRHVYIAWLWERIRLQGGAYGADCLYDRYSGVFSLRSWFDPNLLKTLDTYDRTAEFLRAREIGESELTRLKIGTIGEIDTYRLPDAEGFASLQCWLIGDSDEARQRMREEVLATSAADIRGFADAAAQVAAEGRLVVLGSAQALEAANAQRQGFLSLSRAM